MTEYMAGLSFLEKIYLMCSIFGGGIFVLRTILMLSGFGDMEADVDADVDVDVDADVDTDSPEE